MCKRVTKYESIGRLGLRPQLHFPIVSSSSRRVFSYLGPEIWKLALTTHTTHSTWHIEWIFVLKTKLLPGHAPHEGHLCHFYCSKASLLRAIPWRYRYDSLVHSLHNATLWKRRQHPQTRHAS